MKETPISFFVSFYGKQVPHKINPKAQSEDCVKSLILFGNTLTK